ncbi:MAG TPA: hypothetical protein VE977_10460 [Pyrinomonadaceae bacterium]|nr:hypothetical protein [Pyrinomonadaceae bacterium]
MDSVSRFNCVSTANQQTANSKQQTADGQTADGQTADVQTADSKPCEQEELTRAISFLLFTVCCLLFAAYRFSCSIRISRVLFPRFNIPNKVLGATKC